MKKGYIICALMSNPLRRFAAVPLSRYAVAPLRHCTVMPLRHYTNSAIFVL
jgi:hypothetical protein